VTASERYDGARRAIGALDLDGDTVPFAGLSHENHSYVFPRFFPDGRWLAYSSDESGQIEAYVTPLAGPGGEWQVSDAGGGILSLHWLDGEMRYPTRGAGGVQVESVAVETGGAVPRFDSPERLCPLPSSSFFYLPLDRQRSLVVAGADDEAGDVSPLTVVTNWLDRTR